MTYRAALRALLVTGLVACGGDDDGDGGSDPSASGGFLLQPSDPCNPRSPTPSNLFTTGDGTVETVDCALPSDPIEAALEALVRSDGAPVDGAVDLPTSVAVLPESLTSTVVFALDGTGSPSGLPPLVALSWSGTATSADAFELVDTVNTVESNSVRLRPRSSFAFGTRHFVVATRALRAEPEREGRPAPFLTAGPAVEALVGLIDDATLAQRTDLDEAAIARIARERGRLEVVLNLLAETTPAILPEDVVSIHSFDTELGDGLLDAVGARFLELAEEQELPFGVVEEEDNLTAPELLPAAPADVNVRSYVIGRVNLIDILNDDLRIRPDWDTDVRVKPVRFIMARPAAGDGSSGFVLATVGFGRGLNDIIGIAEEAAAPQANKAVMLIPPRCVGPRSPGPDGACVEGRTPSEVEDLPDDGPNESPNGNRTDVVGADGIPDASGQGYFPGDPGRLRDTQVAQALEVLHLLVTLRDTSLIEDVLGSTINFSRTSILAHGFTAPAVTAALALWRNSDQPGRGTNEPVENAYFAAAGAGYRELILNGPSELRASFLDSAPDGITADNLAAYVRRVEEEALRQFDIDVLGPAAADLFERFDTVQRARLLRTRTPDTVPAAAVQAFADAWAFPSTLDDLTLATCDDFLWYSCDATEADREATIEARGTVVEDL
jgi:hypothetical protein